MTLADELREIHTVEKQEAYLDNLIEELEVRITKCKSARNYLSKHGTRITAGI